MPEFQRIHPVVRAGLLAVCLLTFATRILTLTADFPAGIDWSSDLYSDEGWYAGGAINQYLGGSWYVPGDLNTAINSPALQVVDYGWFRLFGLSLVSIRSLTVVFTAFLILLCFMITRKLSGEIPAWISACLLSFNFFLFGYSKLAILEIPMVTLVLLAIWWVIRSYKSALWQAAVLSLIYCLALLTKASALFGLPVLLLATWQRPGQLNARIRYGLVFLGGVGLLYGGYILWVLLNYPQDYLSYNLYSMAPRIEWSLNFFIYTAARVAWNGRVIDPVMYFLSILLVPCGLILFRGFRRNSLVQLTILWLVVFSLELIPRGYLPPRYYLIYIVPVTILFSILMSMGVKDLELFFTGKIARLVDIAGAWWSGLSAQLRRLAPALLITGIGLFNLGKMAAYLYAPEYTYINAITNIQQRIQASGDTHPVLLGASAQTMSIEIHIPTTNTQYGTQDLLWKLERYRPTFYVAVGPESKVVDQISQMYNLKLLATYDVFGNYYAGKPLYFYRLIPIK